MMTSFVIPAKAGTHGYDVRASLTLTAAMGSRFRGNDDLVRIAE
jgi:hypothetical protein